MSAKKLSAELHHLAEVCKSKQSMTMKELAHLMGQRALALLTLIFSLPSLLVIPLPGLSTLFGVIVFLNGIRLLLLKGLWFPGFIMRRSISHSALEKVFRIAIKITEKVEKFTKIRWLFLVNTHFIRRFNGALIAVNGIIMGTPLPPGSGVLPGLSTIFLSLGILEEDGLFIALGYLFFLLNAGLVIYIAYIAYLVV